MAIFELLGNLGLIFGMETFIQQIQPIFFGYMVNTAAAVRMKGIYLSGLLAAEFSK